MKTAKEERQEETESYGMENKWSLGCKERKQEVEGKRK